MSRRLSIVVAGDHAWADARGPIRIATAGVTSPASWPMAPSSWSTRRSSTATVCRSVPRRWLGSSPRADGVVGGRPGQRRCPRRTPTPRRDGCARRLRDRGVVARSTPSPPAHPRELDGSFVDGLHDPSANTLTVLRAVASIAAEWNLIVIHEGVETEAQAVLVRSVGPSLQQGFLYARPAPTPSFEVVDSPAQPSGDDAAR